METLTTVFIRHRTRFAALVLAAAVAACQTVPYTDRSQFVMLSPEQERSLGATAFEQVLADEKLSTNPQHLALVQRVGTRIARAAEQPGYEWEFRVIDNDKMVNAFALPGGKVAVYTGILPIAQDETGLAVVMGHEVAHAIAHHGAERMTQGTIAELLQAGLLGAIGSSDPGTQALVRSAFGITANVGLVLPFGRRQESEADEIGLILMAKAGYDPTAAIGFWQRMSAGGGDGPPEFLSTHPSGSRRINDIRKALPEALKYYNKR